MGIGIIYMLISVSATYDEAMDRANRCLNDSSIDTDMEGKILIYIFTYT